MTNKIEFNKFIGLDTGQSRRFKCPTRELKEVTAIFKTMGFEVRRIGGGTHSVKIDETKKQDTI